MTELATSDNDTFLNFTSDLVRDVSLLENFINISSIADGLEPVRVYTNDDTPPQLIAFRILDMDEGLVVLEFSEPVSIDALVPGRITLRSEAASNPTEQHALTGGMPSYLDALKTIVEIRFNPEDLLTLKLMTVLATSQGTSYLSMEMGAIQDTAGNDVIAVSATVAVLVDVYQFDMSFPELVRYSFDLIMVPLASLSMMSWTTA